jgi:hypothetical protein
MARDNLTKAQTLIKDGENERANLFLGQSQADAELALAIAHEGAERGAVLAAQTRLQSLSSPGTTVMPPTQTPPVQAPQAPPAQAPTP